MQDVGCFSLQPWLVCARFHKHMAQMHLQTRKESGPIGFPEQAAEKIGHNHSE